MLSHFWDPLLNKYGKKTIDAYAEKNCEKEAGDMIEKKESQKCQLIITKVMKELQPAK